MLIMRHRTRAASAFGALLTVIPGADGDNEGDESSRRGSCGGDIERASSRIRCRNTLFVRLSLSLP